MAFFYQEKAFNRVARNKLWQILKRRGLPFQLSKVIKELYRGKCIYIVTGKRIVERIFLVKDYDKGVVYVTCPTFNIYVDDLLREWKQNVGPGTFFNTKKSCNIPVFVNDQVISQHSENKLHNSVHPYNLFGKEYSLKIWTFKTKIMAITGKHIVYKKLN
jgi:hypothetical protein